MAVIKRPALGRGLDSLIAMDDAPARDASAINEIELSRISPNPDQPRSIFDEEALEELSRSVTEFGIIQPISLRKTGPDTYQIIAGERRYRAALMAGLTTIPAYIEHTARGPQRHRDRSDFQKAHRPLRTHPGTTERTHRQKACHHRQLHTSSATPCRSPARTP